MPEPKKINFQSARTAPTQPLTHARLISTTFDPANSGEN